MRRLGFVRKFDEDVVINDCENRRIYVYYEGGVNVGKRGVAAVFFFVCLNTEPSLSC